jgi:hypothetical protein
MRECYGLDFTTTINSELAMMFHQEHGFISKVLFEDLCYEVFFPELEERRQCLGYWGEAVLILDGLGCHDSNQVQEQCFQRGCWIQLLPLIQATKHNYVMSVCLVQ